MQFETKILAIIIVIMFIILYKKTENMSNSDIKKLIEDEYRIDVDSIRNLSKMANDLTINNSLKIPGGLNVEGPLNFLPKGTIVAFNGTSAPVGWAVCDGRTVNGYKTPDLRGRFIRMHTYGKLSKDYDKFSMKAANRSDIKGYSRNDKVSYITKQNFSEYGGSDLVKMLESEMPTHSHSVNINSKYAGNHTHKINSDKTVMHSTTYNRGFKNGGSTGYDSRGNNKPTKLNTISTLTNGNHRHNVSGNTANAGSGSGHNNTPPYYVLTWIVKVI